MLISINELEDCALLALKALSACPLPLTHPPPPWAICVSDNSRDIFLPPARPHPSTVIDSRPLPRLYQSLSIFLFPSIPTERQEH